MSTKNNIKEDKENPKLDATVKIVWYTLNTILVIYALVLFILGKYCKRKDSLSYVIIFFFLFNYFLQKNYPEENKGILNLDSARVTEIRNYGDKEDKKIPFIEAN